MGAIFYLTGFYLRVAPAVITAELMKEFNLGAMSLGNLSASYYYAYMAMQIPTGMLADSWGPRRLLTAGAVVAALGTFIFALANQLFWANLGRALIGGSVAVAFVVCLKLASHWLAPHLFALASGMGLFFGVIGAITAGVPLRLLVDSFGWRSVMIVSGGFVLSIAIASWLFVRDDPSSKGFLSYAPKTESTKQPLSPSHPFHGLAHIFRYRNTWLLFLAPGGIVGPVLAFAGLWGVPFLRARFRHCSCRSCCSLFGVNGFLGSECPSHRGALRQDRPSKATLSDRLFGGHPGLGDHHLCHGSLFGGFYRTGSPDRFCQWRNGFRFCL